MIEERHIASIAGYISEKRRQNPDLQLSEIALGLRMNRLSKLVTTQDVEVVINRPDYSQKVHEHLMALAEKRQKLLQEQREHR